MAVLSTLELFSSYSGLKLNYEKSSIFHIRAGLCPSSLWLKLFLLQKAKILGIWLSRNRLEEDHYLWNYSPLLDKQRNTCSAWNNRSLSLNGKVTVFNALVSSHIQYVNMNTSTPTRVITEVCKIATLFLWDKKRSKIAYDPII